MEQLERIVARSAAKRDRARVRQARRTADSQVVLRRVIVVVGVAIEVDRRQRVLIRIERSQINHVFALLTKHIQRYKRIGGKVVRLVCANSVVEDPIVGHVGDDRVTILNRILRRGDPRITRRRAVGNRDRVVIVVAENRQRSASVAAGRDRLQAREIQRQRIRVRLRWDRRLQFTL